MVFGMVDGQPGMKIQWWMSTGHSEWGKEQKNVDGESCTIFWHVFVFSPSLSLYIYVV